ASVCTRFMTVLGPGSDWYHEDHIHLDLAERRNNYKLCQWGVYDPLPEIAPLMPAERPSDAPPRPAAGEVTDKTIASPPPPSEDGPVEDGDKEPPSNTKPKSKKRPSAKPQ
ncbi:MAG TPA: extensin family protein, partial [Afipia sp.]